MKLGTGLFVSRLIIGLMFLFTGITKILNPAGIIDMLSNMGFPAAAFFGWVLLLSEMIFGAAVLVGYKVKYTTIPLIIVLLVAAFMVHLPSQDPMAKINFFMHLAVVGGLFAIMIDGSGRYAYKSA
ncbi:DoxX family protein [Candidatus Woesearchaeota archaeon]|nr:DoxX family protein [Candidatus Woesearchaeota archaeon]